MARRDDLLAEILLRLDQPALGGGELPFGFAQFVFGRGQLQPRLRESTVERLAVCLTSCSMALLADDLPGRPFGDLPGGRLDERNPLGDGGIDLLLNL